MPTGELRIANTPDAPIRGEEKAGILYTGVENNVTAICLLQFIATSARFTAAVTISTFIQHRPETPLAFPSPCKAHSSASR